MPKSMRPNGLHPQVLKELADVTVGPLSIIFKIPWWLGKAPEDWKKANTSPTLKKVKEEDLWNYRPYLYPWEGDAATNPGNYFQTHQGQEDDWEKSAWIY